MPFSFFPGLRTVWTWYANHASYFGHLRYIHSVRVEGCLVVAYLERSILTLSQFFQLFFPGL